MQNSLEKYISKTAGTLIDYDWVYWSQCVDLIKNYTANVMNIRLGTFWWSAKTGWYNESNTFPTNDWDRIENDITKYDQVPSVWDIIFIKTGTPYDHVAIVRKAPKWSVTFEVFEQNTGNGDWYGYDDRCRINTYNYNDVYGWYTPKKFFIEYRGVPVIRLPQPKDRPLLYGRYGTVTKAIYIYDVALELSDEEFAILVWHEWSHKVYWSDMTKEEVKAWESLSRLDDNIEKAIKDKFTKPYWVNKYISPWETNESEDFAETYEDILRNPDAVYRDIRDIKRTWVKTLLARHWLWN